MIKNWVKQLGAITGLLLLCFLLSSSVSAYRASEYSTNQNWQIGALVSANDNDSGLALASSANNRFHGVVTSSDNGSVVVATSGVVNVKLTDIEGAISKGQELGLASIAGLAATRQSGEPLVGIVRNKPTNWQTKTSSSGEDYRVTTVSVQLTEEKANDKEKDQSALLATIQDSASQIVGHKVAMWQALVALVIAVGGIVLAIGLVLVTGRQSFLALGRNPMAGKIIMSGLWKMFVMALFILTFSLGCSYLILRLQL